MSTDIQQFGGNTPSPFAGDRLPAAGELHQQRDPMERLRKWAELYVQVGTAAKYLASTEFVPDAFRGKPESVAAAMMKAAEMDMDPIDGLQSIYVVKGKVGFSAELMRRRIIEAGHEIRIKESTDTRCVIQGRRKGSDEWQQVTFTAENAKTAGIDIRAYPADKLIARASSRLCRRVFPDVLGGTVIVEDILDGEVSVDTTTVEAAADQKAVESAPIQRKSSPRKAAKKSAPKRQTVVNDPGEQPPLPGDEPASDSAVKSESEQVVEVGQNSQGAEAITKPQLTKLHAMMSKFDLGDRDAGLAWLSDNLKRTITTSKDLSKGEAHALIEQFEAWEAEDAAKGQA